MDRSGRFDGEVECGRVKAGVVKERTVKRE